MANENREETLKKLNELVKDINFAMLTTAESDGTLRSRPMATQKAEFDGDLYFFTNEKSPKVDEIEKEHQVNVSYSKPEKQTYISMSGAAQIIRDRAKIEELWTPDLKAWFPKGLEDPNIALLKINVSQAEYWDNPNSTVVYLIGMAKAIATGETYKPGENEKINL
ncbi:MAG: pyridoxamine 5'-phosphate oxidase family protein [Pyrinomonadaceae bacterium]|nr:pyridoxamine 5'-phosphate oxidase family protein [Pyrinomonadaceae bacterium]